jgi:hypothetical protein
VKNPFQDAVFCPAVDSDVDGMPGAEGFRKGPLFTAVFADIDEGIKKLSIIDFHISPLFGEDADNFVPLFSCYFHGSSISYFISVNRP